MIMVFHGNQNMKERYDMLPKRRCSNDDLYNWYVYKNKLIKNIDMIDTDNETAKILSIMKHMVKNTKVTKKSIDDYFNDKEVNCGC